MPSDIIVEEIDVETSLDRAGNPHEPVHIVLLSQPTVDPVQEVKSAAEEDHINTGGRQGGKEGGGKEEGREEGGEEGREGGCSMVTTEDDQEYR